MTFINVEPNPSIMKNIIAITFLFMFVFSGSVFGQLSLNFFSGINHSNYEFKNVDGIIPQGKLHYFIGIAPKYEINKKVNFLTNFQYIRKGYQTGIENNLTTSEYGFSYLEIIPEIEYELLNFLSLGLGVAYGIKLIEQFKVGERDWSDAGDFESIKSTDLGLTGKLKVKHKNLFGFVRYNLGFKDVNDLIFTDNEGKNIDNVKQLNRNLQIGIGYTLNLKKS